MALLACVGPEPFDATRQSSTGVVYVNFLNEEGEDRVRAAYPRGTFERLAQLKQRYDPDNFFRLNQNVPPSARMHGDATFGAPV